MFVSNLGLSRKSDAGATQWTSMVGVGGKKGDGVMEVVTGTD